LILPDEIVPLTMDDASGDALGRTGMAAGLALAGAVLMELFITGWVDTDSDLVRPPSQVTDPLIICLPRELPCPTLTDDALNNLVYIAFVRGISSTPYNRQKSKVQLI
jgi:hypothetical protein